MGRAKEEMMARWDDERSDWIREHLENPEADEDTVGWYEAAEVYDQMQEGYGVYDDDWAVSGKTRFEVFVANMDASTDILNLSKKTLFPKNLLVMLHAHVVTAVEAYLSSTFIEMALSSEQYMRKLVETDPEFANITISMKNLFAKREALKDDLSNYLKGVIFHNIVRAKQLYLPVLGINFGQIKWLLDAVSLRHDCVHRAGYDKDGDEVQLTEQSIKELIEHCLEFIRAIELEVDALARVSDLPIERWFPGKADPSSKEAFDF